MEPQPDWIRSTQRQLGTRAQVGISHELRGAVTYGVFRPWVLLPASFPDAPREQQLSVLCHELHHVARRDWAYKIAEELALSLTWFHPAIWWLAGRIQLAREQVVDQLTVAFTGERQHYLDALIAVAEGSAEPDLAPATSFLKKHHLRRRVKEIIKESHMSKRHMLTMLAVLGASLAYTTRYAVNTFPFAANAQTTEVSNQGILHRSAVEYPSEAIRQRVQGTVVVEVNLDSSGHVTGEKIVSGPELLQEPALKSVVDWHFSSPPAPGTTQVSIDFKLPEALSATPPPTPRIRTAPNTILQQQFVVKQIDTSTLSDTLRDELMRQLTIREGAVIEFSELRSLQETAKKVDEHMTVSTRPLGPPEQSGPREIALTFAIPGTIDPNAPPAPPPSTGTRVRVGAAVMSRKLISQAKPVYPPLARQARISGVVHFIATIATDGTVKDLQVISGHPLLIQAAQDAVKQWKYEPTLLNGEPVEVLTQIDLSFTLSEGMPFGTGTPGGDGASPGSMPPSQ